MAVLGRESRWRQLSTTSSVLSLFVSLSLPLSLLLQGMGSRLDPRPVGPPTFMGFSGGVKGLHVNRRMLYSPDPHTQYFNQFRTQSLSRSCNLYIKGIQLLLILPFIHTNFIFEHWQRVL